MKRLLLLLTAIFSFEASFSQNTDYTKGSFLGFGLFLNDFQSASVIRTDGIVDVFKNHEFFKTSEMSPGISVNYLSGLSKHVDFIATLEGSFLNYPNQNVTQTTDNNKFLMESTASLNLKLLTDRYVVVPYIDLGVGASKYGKYLGAFIPLGAGLQVNIADEVYLLLNSQYRVAITENASYHFYHSIGIAGNISKKKLPPPPKAIEIPPAPLVSDRDHDGIVDSLDACPDQPGTAALHGCPDRDGYGIADIVDKCPDVPGVSKYQGCPIPDTDGDGINDEEDKCPTVAGVARYQGCPIPDTDGDGVNDEEDKCPTEVGPASNFGCPVINVAIIEKVNKAAQNIFFTTGSSKLLPKSFKSLKEVVQILKDNPSYKIDVDGYTDNVGNKDKNQVLSEKRSGAVKAYLVGNGIDESKIASTGHGMDDPIANNKTATGRAKNRRVEMKLRNY